MPQNNYDRKFYGNNGGNYGTTPKEATAPYNFVPLPLEPVPSPLSLFLTEKDSETGKVKLNFSKYADYIAANGKYDGIIDFKITALTPLFIGDGNGNFFAPGGVPTIPGSTIRGMVKNYLKILSCGTMRSANNEDITSRHLYFRGLASPVRKFRDYYAERISTPYIDKKGNKKNISKAQPGFLARLKNGEYVIFPANLRLGHYPNESDMRNRSGKIFVKEHYVELHSGAMKGKATYYILSVKNWDRKQSLCVSQEVIDDYKNDLTRKGLDLLDGKNSIRNLYSMAKNEEFTHLVPCFYLSEDDINVEHFGAAKFYRIPYYMPIESHIPNDLKSSDIIDFSEAIFGRKEDFASRIFFEDAEMVSGKLLNSEKSHNLMSPNPTSFQLYLEQSQVRKDGKNSLYPCDNECERYKHCFNVQDPKNTVMDWDCCSQIRGYKLYWHRKIDNSGWKFTQGKDKEVKGTLPMRPAEKGSVFNGKIRFKNLSAEELGALVAVLNLGINENGNNGRFKIGMGKPLGMGSIEFSYTLQLVERQQRYSSLFSNACWATGLRNESKERFLNSFKEYMKKHFKANRGHSYDEIKKVLAIMMDYSKPPVSGKVEYMPIGVKWDKRFANRIPLQYPEDVKK